MSEFKTNPQISLTVECRDKDGNLLWTDGTIIPLTPVEEPVEEQKEADNGRSSDDRGQER